jgi:uncharacterized protein (DUF983 family)
MTPPVSERPRLLTVIKRGWRGRCPRCGEGRIFRRFLETFDRCSACHLLYQRDYGDTFGFMIITDRIPILAGIVALYFGFTSSTPLVAGAFFAVLIIPIIATMRQRQGVAIALDYLSRVYFADPSDEIHGGPARII